jgi:O-antigen biosynthesis protein
MAMPWSLRAMRVLMIGYVWPEPLSSAAGFRTQNLIEAFLNRGWEVVFSSPSKDNPHRQALAAQGIRTHCFAANDPAFDQMIREERPEVVVFDRFVIEEQFGWRVRENAPECVRILDTQDLHCLRRARESTLELHPLIEGDDLNREMASIYRCDLTLVISDHELVLLQSQLKVPSELLHLFRFAYKKGKPEVWPVWREREGFCMIGNFRHPPNLDGFRWFHGKIWPEIKRQLPSAVVRVYGAYPPREAMALHDPRHGFHVEGWVEDQFHAISRHRVNLAPLRFGAGIKGKISDGWHCGTPIVSTPIGAEGMGSSGAWGGTIANDEKDFSRAAVLLHEDHTAWDKAQTEGFNLMRELFDFSTNTEALVSKIQSLHADVAAARSRNPIGAMLWHHTLQSTKIELKNSAT